MAEDDRGRHELPADVRDRAERALLEGARRRREEKLAAEKEKKERRPMRIYDIEDYRIEQL
jgi:hypothetical protein